MHNLSRYFDGLAWKRLRLIDVPDQGSNQHELQGASYLRQLLGPCGERRGVSALWRGFDEDGQLAQSTEGSVTWYDARARNPKRPAECRLYYPSGTPMDQAAIGDLLLVGRPRSGGPLSHHEIVFYLVPWESTLRLEVTAALGIADAHDGFAGKTSDALQREQILAIHEDVLRTLEPRFVGEKEADDVAAGVEAAFADFFDKPSWDGFPSPQELAAFARKRVPVRDLGPDDGLVGLLEAETRAFHVLEHHFLTALLDTGFESVEDFLDAGMRVGQRRRSRRGRSLELHLKHVFETASLRFECQVAADGDTTVDFLFPGIEAYRKASEPALPEAGVVSLAAKSTIKERWRQVLREARKLAVHHLCTLQAGSSTAQLAEMKDARVVLVVPPACRKGYPETATEVLDLAAFIELVRSVTR